MHFMLNHISLSVRDLKRSALFYTETLAIIGIKPLFTIENEVIGFGIDRPTFWINTSDDAHPMSKNVHVAFSCASRSDVDSWYNAAISAGAKNNGKPGLRPQYHENYYGAFVIDPDGNNIEAVCGNT